jgi:hypothetical protein
MELRLDRLLHKLRENPPAILEAIDRDPLLLKRESGSLVLANASQALYTPQQEHQLYAKGIVYQRNPYRLVSLPLIKIYNLGERDVTLAELTALLSEPNVRLRFPRKIDGSLIQTFRHDDRVYFTTRGAIEGSSWRSSREEGDEFDYLGTARRLAAERYPRLLDDAALLDGRTLSFELIHPLAKKVTNYGERADLILLASLDLRRLAYAPYPQVATLAAHHGLTVVDALSPSGTTPAEQIDSLLNGLAGTDEEGSVLHFENDDQVIYRVKVKSPDYLRLMRTMAECTYDNLAALMDDNPGLKSWEEVQTVLRARGREEMPEEILVLYRPHYERFLAYLADCERLRQWATQTHDELERQLGGCAGKDAKVYRKSFAALAKDYPHANLLFAALDGRLEGERMRRLIRDPDEARQALRDLELPPGEPAA